MTCPTCGEEFEVRTRNTGLRPPPTAPPSSGTSYSLGGAPALALAWLAVALVCAGSGIVYLLAGGGQ